MLLRPVQKYHHALAVQHRFIWFKTQKLNKRKIFVPSKLAIQIDNFKNEKLRTASKNKKTRIKTALLFPIT